MKTIAAATFAALLALPLMAGGALAQAQPAPAPAAKAPAVKAPAGAPAAKPGRKVATTPWGKECSAEADAQNLKGKERQKFRRKCVSQKKAAAKKS